MMKAVGTLILLSVVGAVIVVACLYYADKPGVSPVNGGNAVSRPSPRAAVLGAQGVEDLRSAYQAYFQGMSRAKLEESELDPDMGIALHAAWASALEATERGFSPRLQRFLGFLKGRTRVPIPRHWEAMLTIHTLQGRPEYDCARALREYARDCSGVVTFPGPPGLGWVYLPTRLTDAGLGLTSRDGVQLTRQADRLVVKTRHASGTMQYKLFQEALREVPSRPSCTAAVGPAGAYLLIYERLAESSHLSRFDSDSGLILWEARPWCLGPSPDPAHGSGSHRHEVDLVVTDKLVVVFGGESYECYLEAFDSSSGHREYYFSTLDVVRGK
jgi:hypothetical protein